MVPGSGRLPRDVRKGGPGDSDLDAPPQILIEGIIDAAVYLHGRLQSGDIPVRGTVPRRLERVDLQVQDHVQGVYFQLQIAEAIAVRVDEDLYCMTFVNLKYC